MVFAVVMLIATFLYCTSPSGSWRLLGLAFFGICGLVESHDVIKALVQLDSCPAAVTTVPFAVVGALLLRAALREWRKRPQLAPARAGSPQ